MKPQYSNLQPIKSIAALPGAPSGAFLAEIAEAHITGYLILVTPHLAEQWLAANADNRRIRPSHVDNLAEEMRTGRWRVTHQGIAFSSAGRLIDGQHRLHAILASGQPCTLAVFTGLDDDMFGALDRGARRTVSDEMNEDPRLVEPCTWIARVMRSNDKRSPSPAEVADIFDLYRQEAKTVLEGALKQRTGRTAAPIKGALMLRLHDTTPAQHALLVAQWKAFTTLEVKEMDTSTASLLKRLEGVGMAGRNPSDERGACAWIAFHPGDRHLQKIIVRELSTELAEIRATVHRHMRDREDAQHRQGRA
jgi:hypothetical protein